MKPIWGETTIAAATLAFPTPIADPDQEIGIPKLPAANTDSLTTQATKTISKYWPRADRGLDVLSLSLAGLRDGIGPILTLYLVREIHLNPMALSWVVAAPGIAAMFSQTPIGFLYDRIPDKRKLLVIGAILLAASCFSIGFVSSIAALIGLQLMFGFANCLLSAGVPALSVSAAGSEGLGRRLARNEVFSKIGNFSVLGAVGYLTQVFSVSWLFYSIPLLAAPVVGAARGIPPAKGIQGTAAKRSRLPFLDSVRFALRSRSLCFLIGLAFLYQFAAAGQLMTFEQAFVKTQPNGGTATVASAMVLTQLVISAVVFFLGRTTVAPYRFLVFGFLVIAMRALVFAAGFGIPGFYLAQCLDGIAAAILLTIPMRILAMRDQANFNMTSGMVATCVSIGSTASLLTAGYVIATYDSETTFFVLTAVALVGFVTSLCGLRVFGSKVKVGTAA